MKIDKKRLGKCYQLSGNYTVSHRNYCLVHGSIQGFGMPRIKHAWVLIPAGRQGDGDRVWEPTTNEIWEVRAFNAFFHPEVDKTYSHKEARAALLLTSHFGPWTDV